jgi:hypothetical protein
MVGEQAHDQDGSAFEMQEGSRVHGVPFDSRYQFRAIARQPPRTQEYRRNCESGPPLTQAIDKARDRILTAMLADWSAEDIATLALVRPLLADSALVLRNPWRNPNPRRLPLG